jgi:hypothetical protein
MNKTIIGLVILMMIPLVLGAFGGESTLLYHFEDPSIIEVQVSAEQVIDQGEYSLRDCSETTTNEWRCITEEPFDLILDTMPNTVNNYSFVITYYYGEDCPDCPSGSSGGSGGTVYIEVPGENNTITIYEYEECEEQDVVDLVEEETTPWGVMFISFCAGFGLGLAIYLLKNKNEM